jgi:hypothetical protein
MNIKAEFHSLYQGDMSVMVYCDRFMRLVNNLRDVGQPVNDDNHVLNLLRRLSPMPI